MKTKVYWGLGVLMVLLLGAFVLMMINEYPKIKQFETEARKAQDKANQTSHWIECRGGCGKLFPLPTITSGETIYHDHVVVCQEPVYSWWNPWAKCGKKYFSCTLCDHRASEGVFLNQKVFYVHDDDNDTLFVKAKKDNLYMINMFINGSYELDAYPCGDNNVAIIRKTFLPADVGNHSITINVYYGDPNAPSHSKHGYNVTVE